MPSHSCPFCGYTITKDNILFVNNNTERYIDLRKYCFLKLCASQWDLGEQFDDGFRTPGLYHRVSDAIDDDVKYDAEGLPLVIRVHPHMGRTPTELEEEEQKAETPSNLHNFIQMYKNKHPDEQLPSPHRSASSAAAFGVGAIADDGGEAGEYKPADDGSVARLATRVCPNCHTMLHQKFGTIDTINITMLGGMSAGKTAYLVALVHQLEAQLAPRNLGTATLLPASEHYYHYLNSACQTAGGTAATPSEEKLFPFIFYYMREDKECFICFYDIAGEDTLNINSLLDHRGIMEAETLMLMIDPNQLNNGAYFSTINQAGGNVATSAVAGQNIGTSFNRQIDSYLSRAIGQNLDMGILKSVRHVVTVITKIDMPLMCDAELFGDTELYIKHDLQSNHHNGGMHQVIIDAIHTELNIFLQYKTGHIYDVDYSFNNIVAKQFPAEQRAKMKFDLLAVSTYTRRYVEGAPITFECNWDENASKHRIIEPLLVILAQNHMIDVI